MKKENKEIIQISKWARVGKMLILREALPEEHPESYYNSLKREGVDPEDYGYFLFLRDESKNIIGLGGNLNKVRKVLSNVREINDII